MLCTVAQTLWRAILSPCLVGLAASLLSYHLWKIVISPAYIKRDVMGEKLSVFKCFVTNEMPSITEFNSSKIRQHCHGSTITYVLPNSVCQMCNRDQERHQCYHIQRFSITGFSPGSLMKLIHHDWLTTWCVLNALSFSHWFESVELSEAVLDSDQTEIPAQNYFSHVEEIFHPFQRSFKHLLLSTTASFLIPLTD